LGELGAHAEPALPALIAAAREGPEDLRHAAIRSLGCIGKAHKPAVAKVLPPLATALREKGDPEIRTLAAFAIGMMGPEAREAVPVLREHLPLREVTDPKAASYIRGNVLWALGEIGPSAADAIIDIVEVVEGLKSSSDDRRSAIEAIGKMGRKAEMAMPTLKRAAADPDAQVRNAAQKVLSRTQQ
jgi:HEAT repeat protein